MNGDVYTAYAEATIVDRVSTAGSYAFIYEFTTKDGQLIRERGAISKRRSHDFPESGSTVGVYYDPNHPELFRVEGSLDSSMGAMNHLHNPMTILLVVGIIIGIIIAIVILLFVL